MRKYSAIIMCAVILLCGCGKAPTETASELHSETTTDTTQSAVSSKGAVSTEDKIIETSEAPDITDYPTAISPIITDKTVIITAEETIDLTEISAHYGYDIDYTEDEAYQRAKKYCEQEYSGKELEEWRSRNFFAEKYVDAAYIGNENADWVVKISYGYPNVQLASYENFVFIEDGEIAYETGVMAINQCGWQIDGNDCYVLTSAQGIIHIDLLTGEYDAIPATDWSGIADINDDYFIFGNGDLMAYDRKKQEVVELAVDINWCGLDKHLMMLDGEVIKYTLADAPDQGYYLNIETGENGVCEGLHEDMNIYYQNEDFHLISANNTDKYDGSVIKVTRLSDGLIKCFDMTGFPDEYIIEFWSEYSFNPCSAFVNGEWIFPEISRLIPVAVNFETCEAAKVEYEIRIFLNTITEDDGRYFGTYWDKDDNLRAGEIFINLPVA